MERERRRDGRRRAGALVLALQVLLAMLVIAPASGSTPTTTDRVRALLEGELAPGDTQATVGLYLREVGATLPLAAFNETFAYEPASALKALPHFVMMRRVQDGSSIGGEPVTLDRGFDWLADATKFEGGVHQPGGADCPTDNDVQLNDRLEDLLRWMMVNSDNATTEAVRQLLWPGDITIEATQLTLVPTTTQLGMTSTVWRHVMGCGWSNTSQSNRTTLVDLTNLYEQVATGYLDAGHRATAFQLMNSMNAANLTAIVNEEAAALGLNTSSTLVTSFRAGIESATKSGFYPIGGRFYETTAGWASIPRRNMVTCVPDDREYVYGAFINDSERRPPTVHREELFREVIHDGLASYAACTADLVHLGLDAVDPPTTVDVNTATPVTLRHTVSNLGPGTVDARIATTLPFGDPACEVVLPSDTFVANLAPGSEVTREVTATVTCSEPGSRSVTFRGSISPFLASVTDPVLTNNARTEQVTLTVQARADLEVLDLDLAELDAAGLGDFLVGSSTWFDTSGTIINNGDTVVPGLYTDPVGAWLDHTIEVPAGLTASVEVTDDEADATIVLAPDGEAPEELIDQPAGTIAEVTGPATITVRSSQASLAIAEPRVVALRFAVGCAAPGDHDLGLEVRVTPDSEFIFDPDPSNDAIVSVRTVTCVTPVQPNIRPGNVHNAVNPNSQQAVPVAVLTTEAGEYGLPIAFDASTIEVSSIRFGTKATLAAGGGASPVTVAGVFRDSFELDDTTRDGDVDLQAAFRPAAATGIDADTTQACVTGRYLDAGEWYAFLGCDRVGPPAS